MNHGGGAGQGRTNIRSSPARLRTRARSFRVVWRTTNPIRTDLSEGRGEGRTRTSGVAVRAWEAVEDRTMGPAWLNRAPVLAMGLLTARSPACLRSTRERGRNEEGCWVGISTQRPVLNRSRGRSCLSVCVKVRTECQGARRHGVGEWIDTSNKNAGREARGPGRNGVEADGVAVVVRIWTLGYFRSFRI